LEGGRRRGIGGGKKDKKSRRQRWLIKIRDGGLFLYRKPDIHLVNDTWVPSRRKNMKIKRERDLDLSMTEEMLLTVLLHRELYGLEIIKAVEEATEGKRRIGFGSLYPTLHQLEKKGMVKSRWGDETPEERGGARRKYYTITSPGQKALRDANQTRTRLSQWKPALGRI
jgi:PadR family transcriptional regulator PadR